MRCEMGWLVCVALFLGSLSAGNAGEIEAHSLARLDIVHLVDGKTVRGTVLMSGLRGLVLALERGENGVHQEKFIPRSQILRLQSGTAVTAPKAGLTVASRQQDHPISKENGSYVITEPTASTTAEADDTDMTREAPPRAPAASRVPTGSETAAAGSAVKNKAAPFGLRSQGRRAGRNGRSRSSRNSRSSTSSNRNRTGTPQDLIDRYTNNLPYLDESTIQPSLNNLGGQ